MRIFRGVRLLGDCVDNVKEYADGDLPENLEEAFDECEHNKPVFELDKIQPPGRTEYVLRWGRMDIKLMARLP